jgi:hypothetical protein
MPTLSPSRTWRSTNAIAHLRSASDTSAAPEALSGAEARTSARLPRARRRKRCDAGMARAAVAGMERATVVIDACARESG